MTYQQKHYDVAVIGGGLAGISAAVAAARAGCRVALIGDRPVLGGNASSEIGININGACYNALYSPGVYARETGIIEEIKQRIYQYEQYEDCKGAGLDAALLDTVHLEPNIELFLNTYAYDCECRDDAIVAVLCGQLTTERQFRIAAEIFIDASGDGGIAYRAGARYVLGSEARDTFGESLAPTVATPYTNGATVMFHTTDTGVRQTYVRPSFAYKIEDMPFCKHLGTRNRTFYRGKDGLFHGLWWVEYGGTCDQIADHEDITFELRRIVYGLWDYIKNSGKFPETATHKLTKVCPLAGKRESRRFVGGYMLNQCDVERKRDFDDAVFVGGWPMDLHAEKGIYDDKPATEWNYVAGMFHVPYRCLYSVNVKNLMFAGRNISASHVANGSIRVMGTCAAGGQAAGTAAAYAVRNGLLPSAIYPAHIGTVQSALLKDDQTILGAREQMPFSEAKATAVGSIVCENAYTDGLLPLDKPHLLALPAVGTVDAVTVFVKNDGASETLRYGIWHGTRKENYQPEREVGRGELSVSAGYDGALALPVGLPAGADGKLYLTFEPCGLRLYTSAEPLTGAPSFRYWSRTPDTHDPRVMVTTRLRDGLAFRMTPAQAVYEADNAISGYWRPYGMPNIWVAEKSADAYIDVRLPTAAHVGEVRLLFNTDLAEDVVYTRPVKLIRDYRLVVYEADGTQTETVKTGNFERVNRIPIGRSIVGVRVYPLENYGSRYFEIFGIKLYQ